MKVQLRDIYVGERRRKEMGDVEDLAIDLRTNGQITPITVRPPSEAEEVDDKPWVLVAGGRRLGAAYILGWQEIEAFGREEMDSLMHRVLELHENVKRKEMTWVEVAEANAEILALRQLQDPSLDASDVAREMGMSPSTMSRDVAAARAIQERPHLKKSSSRKAALRTEEMEKHAEAMKRKLTTQEIMAEQKGSAVHTMQQNVICADALEFLGSVDTNTVDLLLTDPPYGINYWSSGHKMMAGGKDQSPGVAEYDDTKIVTEDLLLSLVPEWSRVVRPTGWFLIFTGVETYDLLRQAFSDCCKEHNSYRVEGTKICAHALRGKAVVPCTFYLPEIVPWIWYRPNSRNRPRYPDRHAQNVYEKILVVNAGKGRLSHAIGNLFAVDAEYGEDRIHPNQKPLELAKKLIGVTTFIGDLVLDTTIGSGALLAAATATGRRVKGCDNNPDIVPAAQGLIAKYMIPPSHLSEQKSEERFKVRLADTGSGVADFTEEEME